MSYYFSIEFVSCRKLASNFAKTEGLEGSDDLT